MRRGNVNYLQQIKKNNIDQIRKWISEIQIREKLLSDQFPENFEYEVIHKAVDTIGCTPQKAKEYLDHIFGRDF